MKYPIYEHFHSFQGEGDHCGKAAYFIRTYGCPLQCKWCDSAGTWHKNWVPNNIQKMNVQEIVNLTIEKSGFIVITGGEPCVFNLEPLTNEFKNVGKTVHLETSGAFQIKGSVDWLTVSPKWSKKPLEENVELANEIKLIVENKNSIELWLERLKIQKNVSIWLHPEWSQRNNLEILNYISNFVKRNGSQFRAGWQLHKLYLADNLDENTKNNIPLGGEEKNGY